MYEVRDIYRESQVMGRSWIYYKSVITVYWRRKKHPWLWDINDNSYQNEEVEKKRQFDGQRGFQFKELINGSENQECEFKD